MNKSKCSHGKEHSDGLTPILALEQPQISPLTPWQRVLYVVI